MSDSSKGNTYWKGKTFSEEHKRKIVESRYRFYHPINNS